MRHRLFGLLVMLSMIVVIGGTPVYTRAAGTFTDAQNQFSFTIPDGLTPDDSYTGQQISGATVAALLFPDVLPDSQMFRNNVNIVTLNIAGQMVSPDDLAQQSVRSITNAFATATPDGTGIQSLTVGGQPARQYGYVAMQNGVMLHGTQVAVINGDTAYVITFTATDDTYSAFVDQTHDILTSFMFLDAAAGSGQ